MCFNEEAFSQREEFPVAGLMPRSDAGGVQMVIVCPECGHIFYKVKVAIPESQRVKFPGTPREILAGNSSCWCLTKRGGR